MKTLLIILLLTCPAWGENCKKIECPNDMGYICVNNTRNTWQGCIDPHTGDEYEYSKEKGDFLKPVTKESKTIQSLAESGKICEHLGEHWWVFNFIRPSDIGLTPEAGDIPIWQDGFIKFIRTGDFRICKLCQKKQAWKEEWGDE